MSWALTLSMGKNLQLDKHTLHTDVSVCGLPDQTNVSIVNNRLQLQIIIRSE